jgi:hypothetical protein
MEWSIATTATMIGGLAAAPLLTSLGIRAAVQTRRRLHQRAKLERPVLSIPSISPVVRTADQSVADRAVYELVQVEHDLSKTLQDKTVATLIGASCALLAAFVTAVASVTAFPTSEPLHLFAAAFDVSALATTAVTYRRSGEWRATWIRQRIVTEFFRQWSTVDYPLIAADTGLSQRTDTLSRNVRSALDDDKDDGLDAVLRLGKERLAEIHAAILRSTAVSTEDLRYYLSRRPIRQAYWFATSIKRLDGQDSRRQHLLATLFVVALGGALVKTACILLSIHEGVTWATLAVLISIGIAGASTSMYIGQNQRSLHHRYTAQLRAIEDWFDRHTQLLSRADMSVPLRGKDLRALADAVVQFEEPMIVELADWIGITVDDAMELTPG